MLFRRRDDGFSEVVRGDWEGATVVVLGSGPSLTKQQCDYVRGKARVVAINNAFRLAPWSDLLYFGDERWLTQFSNGVDPLFRGFAGEIVTIEESGKEPGDPRFHILRNKDHLGQNEGLSTDPGAIVSGRSSGRAIINVLTLAGVKKIVLLGYDFRHIEGRDHFPGGAHPVLTTEQDLAHLMTHFRTVETPLKELGIEVLNATPDSALTRFPMVGLETALPRSADAAPLAPPPGDEDPGWHEDEPVAEIGHESSFQSN